MGEGNPGLGPHLHIRCRDLAYLTVSYGRHPSGQRLKVASPSRRGCTRPTASAECTAVATVLPSTESAVPGRDWGCNPGSVPDRRLEPQVPGANHDARVAPLVCGESAASPRPILG